MLDEHDALEGIVVNFTGHPGALGLLGAEQAVGVGAVHGQEAPLVHGKRGHQRGQDERQPQAGADENPD